MFNLFVTYSQDHDDDVWGQGKTFTLHRSRFLEYTEEKISQQFEGALFNKNIKALKNYPCLFMHEQFAGKTRMGKLIDIKIDGIDIIIEYEFISEIEINSGNSIKFSKLIGLANLEEYRTHWAVKDIDIIKVVKPSASIEDDGFRVIQIGSNTIETNPDFKTENDLSATRPSSDDQKPSRDSIISVSGFIKNIYRIRKKYNDNQEFFYRGHDDENYKLYPSLFRKLKNKNPRYLINEDQMYKELLRLNPIDFLNDQTTLDRLVRMQHYGLPTRLLDITSNPLIALYFACCDDPKKPFADKDSQHDGEVIIFRVQSELIKYFDSDTVSCITNLAQLKNGG